MTGMPPTPSGMPSAEHGKPSAASGMPSADPGMPPADTGMPSPASGMPQQLTGKRQRPCSSPPKRRRTAYDHRPAAGPGRPPRRTQRRGADRRPVRVVLPDEPPQLNPAAARALLRILLKAWTAEDQAAGDERRENR
jgi:hypothetical protein